MPAYRILTGDCLTLIDSISEPIAAVVTDPPYGCNNDCDYTRFKGGLSPSRNYHEGITGDDKPFDPSPWLSYPKVALFGYQFFAKNLPVGTILVWNKKRPNQLGKFLSDAELCWIKGGKGVYLFNHVWHGFDRETERGKTLHPTQKPVALFEHLLGRLKIKPGQWVIDPYCGSGACGVACMRAGVNYIGIDIEPAYAGIAETRLHTEHTANT